MKQFLPILCLLAGTAAYAETIQFTGLPLNNLYGTYNGYATATIDGIPSELLICDDFLHTTYVPSGPLDYSVSYLTGATPLAAARFADPAHPSTAITKYEEAAVLLDGLNHTGSGLLLNLTADYQYALWQLFTPSVAAPDGTARTLLNDAAETVREGGLANQALYSELRIFTPASGYASNQEFLQLSSEPWSQPPGIPDEALANPEPSSAILIGIGMGAIALSTAARQWMKRRHVDSTEPPPRT